MEKSVNKFLAYTVIAILLGSVTMFVPLGLLGPDNLVPIDSTYNVPGAGEEIADSNTVPPNSELTTRQQNATETYDKQSGTSDNKTSLAVDVPSGLSSMGLMIVPGFVVALGVFIYLKKRTG